MKNWGILLGEYHLMFPSFDCITLRVMTNRAREKYLMDYKHDKQGYYLGKKDYSQPADIVKKSANRVSQFVVL